MASSTAKRIKLARSYILEAPIEYGGYARLMSGYIRSALSDRMANQYRQAIKQDKLEHLFNGLETSCPTAKDSQSYFDAMQEQDGPAELKATIY